MYQKKFLRFFFLAAAIVTVSTGPVSAQTTIAKTTSSTAGFDRSAMAISYKKMVLNNGLTLLVHEDHSAPVVGVNFWYHVGSRNEIRGKTGFAHLFEHFFFNGSENYPHGFREAMDNLGANNRNGTTNTDRTNFFEDVPVSALERTLYLEADRMGFLSGQITKEMLERERGVVQNEKRQGENAPYGKVFNEIGAKMYPYEHPYSWPTIGSMEDLNAASLDDVKEWYKKYYSPNNAVLALAGDITYDDALQLVTKYFGGIQPGPPLARTEKWIPQLDRNIRDEMQDRVPEARIYRAYHAPAWKEKEIEYLKLFANTLSGAKSAPLDKRLIYDKKLANSVSASVDDNELGSIFYLIIAVKDGVDPKLVEREMDAVINEALTKGPSADELKRAKSRNLAGFSRSIERLGGMGGRSDVLAQSMTYGGSPDAYLDKLEIMANASTADVKAAGQRWLNANHYTMLVKPFPKLEVAKNSLDRSKLPDLAKETEIKFPNIQRATLKNGLNVILMERHTVPIVNVTLAEDAGYSSDASTKAGLASLALDLMTEGTKTRNAFTIEDELDMLGASINSSSDMDLSYIKLQALSQNLLPSLRILADVVLNPSFPEDQFAIKKQQLLSQIAQEKADAGSVAFRILPGLLYGSTHAYGLPSSGSGFAQTVSALNRNDLVQWHKQWFRPGSATVIVTGNTSMDKLLPALESAFGTWAPGQAPAKNVRTVERTKGSKVYLIDKPDAPQSMIVAAHISEANGQPEEIAIETVMRNFGGIATSRLNRNLRLDKHWSYGTAGGLTGVRGQRLFLVRAPVQTDKTKESMQEIIKEIKGVTGERPMEGEEYASIMRSGTLRLPGRFATLNSLDGAAIQMIKYGLPVEYWSQYAGKARDLKEKDLNDAAKKFIRPDEVSWMVVGDLKKIEAGIRSMNLGEVIVLDTDGQVISR
jgi:zinc protease